MQQSPGPFASLDEQALRALVPSGVTRSFPKGAVLVNEGDGTDSLYVLLAGRAKAYVSDESGKEVVLDTIDTGEYFGELVLDGGARSASVMALEACRVFIIARNDMEGLLERNPAFARDLMNRLIGRVRSLTGRVVDLALKDVYGRFLSFVEENAVERDGRRVIPERLTQQDIAARIGGSREMVNRILKDLVAGGYLSMDAKHVTVLRKLPARW